MRILFLLVIRCGNESERRFEKVFGVQSGQHWIQESLGRFSDGMQVIVGDVPRARRRNRCCRGGGATFQVQRIARFMIRAVVTSSAPETNRRDGDGRCERGSDCYQRRVDTHYVHLNQDWIASVSRGDCEERNNRSSELLREIIGCHEQNGDVVATEDGNVMILVAKRW